MRVQQTSRTESERHVTWAPSTTPSQPLLWLMTPRAPRALADSWCVPDLPRMGPAHSRCSTNLHRPRGGRWDSTVHNASDTISRPSSPAADFSPHFLPQTPSLGPSARSFSWAPLRTKIKMRKSFLKAGGPLRRLVLPRSDSQVTLGAWCCCEGVGVHLCPS